MATINDLFQLIGQNIKHIRKNKNLSQNNLADLNDKSRTFVSQLESPKIDKGVSINTLFEWSQDLNVDIRDFFENYESLMKDHDNNSEE